MPATRRSKAPATASTSAKAEPSAASTSAADAKPTYGFKQYAGEGPLFYLRQFGGFGLVVIGALILATSYNEDWQLIKMSPDVASYVSLAVIVLGAIVHELRPWKVRSSATLVRNRAPVVPIRGPENADRGSVTLRA